MIRTGNSKGLRCIHQAPPYAPTCLPNCLNKSQRFILSVWLDDPCDHGAPAVTAEKNSATVTYYPQRLGRNRLDKQRRHPSQILGFRALRQI
jgi:hypothetical protein